MASKEQLTMLLLRCELYVCLASSPGGMVGSWESPRVVVMEMFPRGKAYMILSQYTTLHPNDHHQRRPTTQHFSPHKRLYVTHVKRCIREYQVIPFFGPSLRSIYASERQKKNRYAVMVYKAKRSGLPYCRESWGNMHRQIVSCFWW
jgi:hypothetical protein